MMDSSVESSLGMSKNLCKTIVLGDDGHRGTFYVTPASTVQLFSKLCKSFDLITLR